MNEDYDYTHTGYNIKLSLSVKLIMPNIKKIPWTLQHQDGK
jgi:hypothetical protein